jgi:hypothetical protein
MNSLGKVTSDVHETAVGGLDRRVLRMPKTIHVLSLGPMAHGNVIHDVLLELPDFRLFIATDYLGLWAIPKQEPIHVVVLHNTFSSSELEDSCRLIRRRWPHAGILLVHRGESLLEDALYDDRVVPNVAPEVLLSTIQRLKGRWQGWRSGDVEL